MPGDQPGFFVRILADGENVYTKLAIDTPSLKRKSAKALSC
jgi:hypothetical protein